MHAPTQNQHRKEEKDNTDWSSGFHSSCHPVGAGYRQKRTVILKLKILTKRPYSYTDSLHKEHTLDNGKKAFYNISSHTHIPKKGYLANTKA